MRRTLAKSVVAICAIACGCACAGPLPSALSASSTTRAQRDGTTFATGDKGLRVKVHTRNAHNHKHKLLRRPGTVQGLRVLAQTSGQVSIGWRRARRGSIALDGYRVKRDGEVLGQTHGLSYAVRVSPGTHTITVAAVDLDGHLGPASTPLTVTIAAPPGSGETAPGSRTPGSRGASPTPPAISTPSAPSTPASPSTPSTPSPPSTPGGLKAQTVGEESAVVEWEASTSGEAAGYRVFRDGVTLGQTKGLSMTLEHLAPETGYEITVAAVDAQGEVSESSTPLQITTAPPPQSHGTVQAALLDSTDVSFDDLQAHYRQIGVLYPTYFECGEKGTVSGEDNPLVTGWAQERGVAVMPRLNCQNPLDEEQVLNYPTTYGQKMIEALASLCATHHYQGIQIDFEGAFESVSKGAPPPEREEFTAFIKALAGKLHEQGEKLSTIVTAKTENVMSGRAAMYNDAALAEVSDYVFVLDWGIHWTTSKPGGIDELPWFKKVAEYAANVSPANRSKFVLGMPMYGIDWANEGGPSNPGATLEYGEIVALENEFDAIPEWDEEAADPHYSYEEDGVKHSVWYTDKQSIEPRVALAQSLGLGVGLWHLGNEDQSIWEIPGLGG
jgi:spore germination protein YaaH